MRPRIAALLSLFVCATFSAEKAKLFISEVQHSPALPRSGQAVTITASVTVAPEMLTLEYQVVEPGKYIALDDPAFRIGWHSVKMEKFHSDLRYAAQIPAETQKHRRLVRYRFKGKDAAGKQIVFPPTPAADSDDSPNFAYFVYDGVPAWKAAIQPGSRDAKRGAVVEFPPSVMEQVHVYQLIAKGKDVGDATWYQQAMDKEYRYSGTFVAHGKVYDHIRFRARGGEWRYAMGKNMWKFDFPKSNRLQAYDDYNQPYKASWSKLNLRAIIQQADYDRRGEQGMFESVGFRLFNLAGVDAPRTHWISLRIVDGAEENPKDQYKGDFWGLYLAIENEDGRFLDEHGLPDGNVFKMKFGTGEHANVGEGQPTDLSDLHQLLAKLNRQPNPEWWKQNVNLPLYYSYRSILEAIHHYDLDAGKNYTFYLNPESKKWHVIPWDIDLSWGDHMFGGGREPFMRPVLGHAEFKLNYENRQREIRDLLFNPEETGRLIDECAAIISRRGELSIVDADRAKWDHHPIMNSRWALPQKAGQGLFYSSSPTRDFAGMVQQMKDYVEHRADFIDANILRNQQIPETPKVARKSETLTFTTSSYSGPGKFAALKWRLAEVDPSLQLDAKTKKPLRPGRYEITSTWESDEMMSFTPEVEIPPGKVKSGQTYRVRVRHKDATGRWSHWSAPVQFTAK